MSHTDYENHVRMERDYPVTGIDGNSINLKAGDVVETNPNISSETIDALIILGIATDNPDKHLIFKGDYDTTLRYYTPEVVNYNGSQWKCTTDTPNPCGAFDITKWELKVKGVNHIEPI